MGRFKNYAGMVAMHAGEGLNANGEQLRIERVERPLASTLGIVWIRVFVNGVGISAEQFSRGRVSLADRFFKREAKRIVAAPAEAAALAVRKPASAKPTPETTLLDEGGVQVVMITGSKPRFEIRRANAEAEVVPATRDWRNERKAVLDRARSYLPA